MFQDFLPASKFREPMRVVIYQFQPPEQSYCFADISMYTWLATARPSLNAGTNFHRPTSLLSKTPNAGASDSADRTLPAESITISTSNSGSARSASDPPAGTLRSIRIGAGGMTSVRFSTRMLLPQGICEVGTTSVLRSKTFAT